MARLNHVLASDPVSGPGLIQQRLESKQDGALQQHRVEMNRYTRQQEPWRGAPRVPGEKCEDCQYYVNGKADSVGDSSGSHGLFEGE
jgi:hypothetical protein